MVKRSRKGKTSTNGLARNCHTELSSCTQAMLSHRRWSFGVNYRNKIDFARGAIVKHMNTRSARMTLAFHKKSENSDIWARTISVQRSSPIRRLWHHLPVSKPLSRCSGMEGRNPRCSREMFILLQKHILPELAPVPGEKGTWAHKCSRRILKEALPREALTPVSPEPGPNLNLTPTREPGR